MDNRLKARSVLAHLGRPADMIAEFDAQEVQALAGIYDECVAPGARLLPCYEALWMQHVERLADLKATTPATDDPADPA